MELFDAPRRLWLKANGYASAEFITQDAVRDGGGGAG